MTTVDLALMSPKPRAGVVGRGDALRLAPWVHLPAQAGIIVLFAVVHGGVTIERYRFEVRACPIAGRIAALVDVLVYDESSFAGRTVDADDERLFWPPLDVIEAALLEARRS